jgi:hypothetical protein
MKSRARGSSSTIRKRTSHIRIVLTDEIVIATRKPKAAQSKARKRVPAAKASAPAPAPAPEPAAETETSAS